MINHIRTLLMNVSASAVVPHWSVGDELIDPGFIALATPPNYLTEIRNRLFGNAADRVMLNYRLSQYLPLLHATELAEFVYAPDKRVTYLPFRNVFFASSVFQPTVLAQNGNPPVLQGDPAAPDVTGKTYYEYSLQSVAGSDIAYVLRTSPSPAANYETTVTYTDDLSDQLVPVGDTGYTAMFRDENAQSIIEGLLRPQWELGGILAMFDSIGEPTLDSVFGITQAQPYLTFRNLFYDHTQLAYRLGGLLLATAYRLDEIRGGTSGS